MASKFRDEIQGLGNLWLLAPPFMVGIFCPLVLKKLFIGASGGGGPCWYPALAANQGAAAGIVVSTTFALMMIAAAGAIFAAARTVYLEKGPKAVGRYVLLAYVVLVAAIYASSFIGRQLIDNLGRNTFQATVGAYLAIPDATTDSAASTAPPAGPTAPVPGPAAATPPAQAAPTIPCIVNTRTANGIAGDGIEGNLRALTFSIEVSGMVAVLVMVTMAMAVVSLSTLPEPPVVKTTPSDPPKLDKPSCVALTAAAHDLAERIRKLKYLALIAAVVLATGVAYLSTWAGWPLAFWQGLDKDNDKTAIAFVDAYEAVEGALVNFQSVFFVLIMLSIFGPIAMILSDRGRVLSRLDPELVDKPTARRTWLTDHGLALTTGEQIQRILVFVSPLLAAPVAELAKRLVGLVKP